jgi:hypothetical protein
LNPLNTYLTYFSKIYFKLVVLSKPRSPKQSLPLGLSNKYFVFSQTLPKCPVILISFLLNLSNDTWWRA